MDSVLKSLNRQTVKKSVGDLQIGRQYRIDKISTLTTKYGPSILCVLDGGDEEGVIEAFLPKSINMTSSEAVEYNGRVNKTLSLTFNGRRETGAFDITFT